MAKTLTLHRIGFQQVRQDARMGKLLLPIALFLVFLLGMGLMLVTIAFAVNFSARVFRVGILMHGKRSSLRELVHWYRMAG